MDGSKELAKYNFNFVGKEEVRWEKGYSEQTLKYVSEKKVMLIPTLFWTAEKMTQTYYINQWSKILHPPDITEEEKYNSTD